MSAANESLRTKAYQYLQRKLLSGEWGAGDVISEQTLASELGMSRTPVREAIRHLEQEGVLEQVPRFGTRVKALDRSDLVELYELREALEPYAVAQATGKLSASDAETLHRLCQEIKNVSDELREQGKTVPDAATMKRLMSVDLGFHQMLIRASGNRRMMKIVAESRLLARIFMTARQEHNLRVIEETYRYHLDILSAVESGKANVARELMAEHIRTSMKGALAHYDANREATRSADLSLGLPDDTMMELHRMELDS